MRGSNKSPEPSSPHPADYPASSMASRAAARAMLERRERAKERIRVSVVLIGHREGDPLPESWRVQSERGITEAVYEGDGRRRAAANSGTAVEASGLAEGQAFQRGGRGEPAGEDGGPVKINLVIEDVGA
jgi:hypothetical protein